MPSCSPLVRSLPGGLFFLVALGLLGCNSSNQVAVKGKVTYDDQAVGPGHISFLPIEGTESRKSAAAIVDGLYEVPPEIGPSPGKFRVEISWTKLTGRTIPSPDPGMMMQEVREILPAKFNADSTLTVQITPGPNVHDFALKSK